MFNIGMGNSHCHMFQGQSCRELCLALRQSLTEAIGHIAQVLQLGSLVGEEEGLVCLLTRQINQFRLN